MRVGDCVRFSDAALERLGLTRDTVSGWARGTVVAVRGGAVDVDWGSGCEGTHEAGELERALPRVFRSSPPAAGRAA